MADLLLRWRKPNADDPTNQVTPGTPVQVECLDKGCDGEIVTVKRIPEPAIGKILQRLRGRVGVDEVPLVMNGRSKEGLLSEAWQANQAPPGHKATVYVAVLESEGLISGPLRVSGPVDFTFTSGFGLNIRSGVVTAVAAMFGLPLPATIEGELKTRRELTGTAYATADPSLEVRWLTTGEVGGSIDPYLDSYLAEIAGSFEVPAAELDGAFRSEYSSYLAGSAEIAAEVSEPRFQLDGGESRDVALDLYPQSTGGCLAALALVDADSGNPLAYSDLIGLSVTEDRMVFRDF